MADAKVYPFAPLGTLTPPNTSTQPDKNAVARALGAAFLSHQVQELEKSVSAKPKYDSVPQGRGGRDRRGTRGGQRPQQYQQQRGHAHGGGRLPRGDRDEPRGLGRRSDEREHSSERDDRDDKTMPNKKDADIVVIDASVLVHALGQLKVWCRNGREEVIVVPLEVLNTLDLLKKGTSLLAQRARAASRILEQQVGTNPRIKVQRDEAYVLWDSIPFLKPKPAEPEVARDVATDDKVKYNTPEWVRRTICCARWEFDQAHAKAADAAASASANDAGDGSLTTATTKASDVASDQALPTSPPYPRVIVAVCLEAAQLPDATSTVASPVPLPAPHQASKYEQRCTGAVVAQWAKEAGVPVVEFKATPLPAPSGNRRGPPHGRTLSDEEPVNPGSSPNRSKPVFIRARGGSPFVGGDRAAVFGPGRGGGTLVERPAATMVMNDIVQLSKPIRLLARGEKLEP